MVKTGVILLYKCEKKIFYMRGMENSNEKKKIETKRNLLHFFQKFFFLFHSDIYKSIEKDILDIPIGFLIIQKHSYVCRFSSSSRETASTEEINQFEGRKICSVLLTTNTQILIKKGIHTNEYYISNLSNMCCNEQNLCSKLTFIN